MSKRRAGGYIDRQELSRAVRANRRMTELVLQALREGESWSVQRWLLQLSEMGVSLSEQRDALATMEQIRGGGLDGTCA